MAFDWDFGDILFVIVCAFLSVIGILGNVVNLVVFNEKKMKQSSVNLLYWWLSLGDLLELFCILYELIPNMGVILNDDPFMSVIKYILTALHSFTLVMNITLAILRFLVVWKPIQNRRLSSEYLLIRRIVIGSCIFSVVCNLPHLFWNTIHYDLDDGTLSITPRHNVSVLLFEILVQSGPLVVLIISCIMLIFVVTRARNDRQRTFNSDQTTEKGRKMNQINTLVIFIIIIFIISDIPFIIRNGWSLFVLFHAGNETYFRRYKTFLEKLPYILFPALLVNCSYSIFLYVVFCSQYRKTLKKLLYASNKTCISVLGTFKSENVST